jgi:hypothetical protein
MTQREITLLQSLLVKLAAQFPNATALEVWPTDNGYRFGIERCELLLFDGETLWDAYLRAVSGVIRQEAP